MSQRKRVTFIALKDFKHTEPIGVGNIHFAYSKGDKLFLRLEGRTAKRLLKAECIAIEAEHFA